MDVTFAFLRIFFIALGELSPLLIFLVVIIAAVGLVIGRLEKWSRLNAIYYAFITATTVGYGDMRPGHPVSKFAAIGIALIGILLTGIIVAAGLFAVEAAMKVTGHAEINPDLLLDE